MIIKAAHNNTLPQTGALRFAGQNITKLIYNGTQLIINNLPLSTGSCITIVVIPHVSETLISQANVLRVLKLKE